MPRQSKDTAGGEIGSGAPHRQTAATPTRQGKGRLWTGLTVSGVLFLAWALRLLQQRTQGARMPAASKPSQDPARSESKSLPLPVKPVATRAQQGRQRLWNVLASCGVFFLALALRLFHLDPAFDLHIDEPFYAGVSQSVARHATLAYDGTPFFLHPPAFFLLEGGYIKVFAPTGGPVQVIYALRPLNAFLGALTALCLMRVGYAVAGRVGALATGLSCAVDPFAVHMNSINLLDTPAMFWVAAGYATLLPAIRSTQGVRARHIIVGGTCFGAGILTKDMVAALTIGPFLLCAVLNCAVPRRTALVVAAVAGLWYVPYLAAIVLTGNWRDFSHQKTQGIYRFLGILQVTGFHKRGGPSLVQSVIGNLDQYATTYTWMALGIPCMLLLFYRGDNTQKLASIWAACGYGLLGYGLAHGTLEEQFFYFLIVPVFVAAIAAAVLLARLYAPRPDFRRLILAGRLVLAAAFLGWSGYIWSYVHFRPDNAWEHMYAYVHQSLPQGVSLGVTAWTGVPLLGDYVDLQNVTSIYPLRRGSVQYLEVNSHQIEGHFGGVTPEQYLWLQRHARLVYAFSARSSGTIALYTLRTPSR